jgi:enolase
MERVAIESYLQTFRVEECLDEAINEVVERRPANPYMSIASFMETRCVAEILDVKISFCLAGRNLSGVQATISTNISSFSATTSDLTYSSNISDGDLIREYAVLQEKARDCLKGLDPRKVSAVDEAIFKIPGIEKSIALALSMASCRAGARHRGLPLYRFLAELAGTSPAIPVPVVTVLSRAVAGSIVVAQNITVTPTTPSFIDGAFESVLKASLSVQKYLDNNKTACTVSDCGCPCLPSSYSSSLADSIKLVKLALIDEPVEGGLKLGIDMRSGDVSFIDDDLLQYRFDSGDSSTVVQGDDLAETVVGLWRNHELISVEDPLASTDASNLRLLKEKILSTTADLKEGELAYNVAGVGGELGCILQIVADRGIAKAEQIAVLAQDMAFNSVKLRLRKIGSVSAALTLARACQQAQIAVIAGCDEGAPETNDTFLADLAVALGVGQFAGGGMGSCEFSAKYQRIIDISHEDDSIPYKGRNFRC